MLSLGGVEGYARVRAADRSTLLVERVRSADGRVVDSFRVSAPAGRGQG